MRADDVPDARVPAFLGIPVYYPAAGHPGDLGSGGDVEIFHDPVVEGHELEDRGHEMEELALFGLFKGAGECAAGHFVHALPLVQSLKGRLSPVVMADPFADLLDRGLGLVPVEMDRDARFLEDGLHGEDRRMSVEPHQRILFHIEDLRSRLVPRTAGPALQGRL